MKGKIAFLLFFLSIVATAGYPATGRSLPKFKIKLADGTLVNSKDLAGSVVVIDFWGTWCKPCLAEIPSFNAFFRDYKDKGVRLYGFAADSGTAAKVKEAAQRLKMEYPVAAPSWDELDLFGTIQVFPTTLVFGAQGKLELEILGAPADKHEQLRRLVDRLLDKRSAD